METLPGGHLPQVMCCDRHVGHPLRGRVCGAVGSGGRRRSAPPTTRLTKESASGALYALRAMITAAASIWPDGAMTTADGGWLPQPVVGGNTNVDVGTDLVLRSLRLRLYVWLLGD